MLSSVLKRHGDVHCLYLGDSARVPYGEKRPSEIRLIAKEIVQWLCDQNVSAVLIACNTTNSLALDVVKNLARVPVIGLIESATQMIYEDRVGVLATPATVASGAYGLQIGSMKPGTFVVEQACPALVPLIEAGKFTSNETRRVAIKYLSPLLDANVDAVILGCSHYPLIQPLLRELIPMHIRIIDPAIGLACQIDKILGSPKFSLETFLPISNTRICVTSDPSGFAKRAQPWLGKCPEVELVSLRSKACFF